MESMRNSMRDDGIAGSPSGETLSGWSHLERVDAEFSIPSRLRRRDLSPSVQDTQSLAPTFLKTPAPRLDDLRLDALPIPPRRSEGSLGQPVRRCAGGYSCRSLRERECSGEPPHTLLAP